MYWKSALFKLCSRDFFRWEVAAPRSCQTGRFLDLPWCKPPLGWLQVGPEGRPAFVVWVLQHYFFVCLQLSAINSRLVLQSKKRKETAEENRITLATCEVLGEELIHCSTRCHIVQQYITNVLRITAMNYTGCNASAVNFPTEIGLITA